MVIRAECAAPHGCGVISSASNAAAEQYHAGKGLPAVGDAEGLNMQATRLVDALKRMLKGRGITYAGVAAGLGLSEASVKRMFSRGDFTLQRLEDVCRVASIDFGELLHAASVHEAGMTHLTIEQEEEIVSDPKLLLVAFCAVGHWTLAPEGSAHGLQTGPE